MLTAILSWLSGPVVASAIDAYKAKLSADNDAGRIAADLAAKEFDLTKREAELRSAERMQMAWHHPVMLIGYALAFFILKVVIWDTCFGLGSTPAIRGQVGDWLGSTLNFFVGGSTAGAAAAAVAAILRRR